MSSKLPIGVATIERPLIILSIIYILIFIISCTPVNLSKQDTKNTQETTISEKPIEDKTKKKVIEEKESKQDKQKKILDNIVLDKTIIALFAKDDDEKTTKQFLNAYELGIYNLGISDVVIQIEFFENENDLKKIFPKKYWNKLHLQIIWYGREYCKARDCFGITCKICKSCYPNRKKPIKTKKA